MFSYYLVLVGFLTNSKYAILSSARVIIMNVNLELMLNFMKEIDDFKQKFFYELLENLMKKINYQELR